MLKRYRMLVSLLALFLLSQTSFAESINRRQAQEIVNEWLDATGMQRSIQPSLVSGYKNKRRVAANENASLYVFNFTDDKGFVIVSGDDRTESILGYVDNGSFNADSLPSNMKAWMQCYEEQIERLPADYQPMLASNVKEVASNGPRRVEKKAIPVLVKTHWNQGYPYNMYCPYDGGSQCPTGCSATAMAQCMYYTMWPLEASTTIPAYDVLGQRLEQLPSYTMQWSRMKTDYSGNESKSDASAIAVAKLMQYCGQATRMGYSATGSGATVGSVHDALLKYFDYDASIQHVYRSDYSIEGWENLMYSELANNRPVFYAGYAPGGHAFVCDGYDGNGLFHINWGWGGWDDGYFKLAVLNPDDNSGIGAAATSGGYSMGQEVIIGIQRQMGSKPLKNVHMSINDTKISGTTITSNYINWTGSTNSFHGAIVKQNEDGTYTPISNINTATNLAANYLYNWSFNIAGKLPKGTYKLSPASKLTSSDTWIPLYNMENSYIQAEVLSSTSVKLTMHPVQKLGSVKFEVLGSRTINKEQKVAVTIENVGDEVYRTVCLYASPTSDKGEECSRSQLVIPANSTETLILYFTPKANGVYNLWLTGENSNDVLGTGTTQIGNRLKLTAARGTAGLNDRESYDKLFDGDTDTKWCFNLTGTASHVIFSAERPVFVNGYRLATGGDTKTYPTRNPQSWALYGSTASTAPTATSSAWEEIAVVTDDDVMQPTNKNYYTFYNKQAVPTKAYKHFKLNIRSLDGVASGVCQLSEVDLLTNELYFYNEAADQWLQANNKTAGFYTDRAELGNRGMDMEIIPATGGFQLNPKFGGNHSLNVSDLLMDSNDDKTVWTFTKSTGSYYTIKSGTSYLGAALEDSTLVTNAEGDARKWLVYSSQGRMAQMVETAHEKGSADASWLLQGGDFSKNDERINRWSYFLDGGVCNPTIGDRTTKHNTVFEIANYVSNARLSSTIKNIPNGVYKLMVNGVYVNTKAVAYYGMESGDQKVSEPLTKGGTTTTTSDLISRYFDQGRYFNDSDNVVIEVTNGTLTVFVEGENTTTTAANGRFVVDNFQLLYFGSREEYETSIHCIASDAVMQSANAANAIYNLSGQRMQPSQLRSGSIYLVPQADGRMKKVMVK